MGLGIEYFFQPVQACSCRYIATLIAPPTQSLKSTHTVRTEYFSVYMMASLIGDVKFTADMILELLKNFDKDYQGDLNSFKEGERLECLSAEDISLRLNKRFEVDVDIVRAILKRGGIVPVRVGLFGQLCYRVCQ